MKNVMRKEQYLSLIYEKFFDIETHRFGCTCHYYPLDDKVGVKFYEDCYDRDYSKDLQTSAFEAGIGPETGDDVEITYYKENDERITLFGFLTERLITNREVSNKDLRNLTIAMEKKKFSVCDLYRGNVGYRGDMLLCLDFDEGSTARVK